ncbi:MULTISPECIES: membrane protein insertase YidC [unclassified Colwellia]|uniref:membrane protein insertase YidC n=1 Tax=unclassified Colwellia TaxID=196834 RepID=UPI0015F60B0E|nr:MULTISPECIES: membrane protein insertase YidC [unclassified Colwellia]MBA6290685.1 membrane protein insertase YidC [Colwellia sp. MB3u-4]MBA6294666.1 membrane protein insertase YidC [Colwellia sp. MB02u-9]
MESQRSFLFIALMVVTYLLFNQWQTDKAPILEQPAVTQQTTPSTSNGEFVPESSATATSISNETKVVSATLITVKNDVLSLKIDTNGGDIVEAKLLKFDTEQGNGIPFTILRNDRDRYVAQSGLTGAQGLDRVIPGRPIYQTSATSYQANAGEPLVIDLNYLDDAGLSVTKRFTLNYDSYAINVEYIIANNATSPASVQMYAQLKQTTLIDSSSGLIPTYVGAAYSTTEDIYEKYDFDDIAEANLSVTTQGGWVAMLQHYFVSSWVPEKTSDNQLYTRYSSNKDAVIGFKAPAITIEPNSTATTSATFYVGPKDQDVLESIEQNLDLTIDYGFLFMISQPLFWLLIKIQSIVTNWGVAIIIITLIVKGGMYPLTKAQYTSMAKMRALQPKMAQLKERLGDDKQKMSQAMMELYRKEKVNPAGGCLPLIIQMPIFLALYWVFLESVELRHAPFMLWIQDLSAQDPFYILPVLMGVSMFIMQKMQPMTVQDPMQQKIMQYMPVMFTVFFFWFPSGLVLYWLVSNLISIAQMKIIFSGIEKAKEKEKAK